MKFFKHYFLWENDGSPNPVFINFSCNKTRWKYFLFKQGWNFNPAATNKGKEKFSFATKMLSGHGGWCEDVAEAKYWETGTKLLPGGASAGNMNCQVCSRALGGLGHNAWSLRNRKHLRIDHNNHEFLQLEFQYIFCFWDNSLRVESPLALPLPSFSRHLSEIFSDYKISFCPSTGGLESFSSGLICRWWWRREAKSEPCHSTIEFQYQMSTEAIMAIWGWAQWQSKTSEHWSPILRGGAMLETMAMVLEQNNALVIWLNWKGTSKYQNREGGCFLREYVSRMFLYLFVGQIQMLIKSTCISESELGRWM